MCRLILTFLSILIGFTLGNVVSSDELMSRKNPPASTEFPDSLDWRTKGVITPIYDQGESPHVAAIVMVETIESLYAIETGKLVRGSVARVIDCCASTGISYECIKKLGGICSLTDYPTPRNTCESNACVPFASYDSLDHFRGTDDNALLSFIQKGTFLVGIDASQRSFSTYEAGIYKEENCSQTIDTHALQVVGYGKTDTGEPFWIAKNSWTEEWGEKGYIRILRGKNVCGIATQAYQPLASSMTITTPLVFVIALFLLISF